MPDLLLEIGTEELPASYIEPALAQIKATLAKGLEDARLVFGEIRTAGTPRRLTVWAPGIPARQTDIEVEVSGPPVRVAFDEAGAPTKAAAGFAASQGVGVESLLRVQTEKGEYCAARKREEGRAASDILCELLLRAIRSAPFPKSMSWPGARAPFARPIRRLVALLGEDVVPVEAFGVTAGRASEGHPFLAPGDVEIETADWQSYREKLRRARVMVDPDERRSAIAAEIEAALAPFGGRVEEEWLLDEVVNLVQWPKVVMGSFAPKFLEVPAPAVVAAMTEHQRYFPVREADGRLQPHFLVVTDRGEVGVDTIRRGNERVLHARLADAEFFFRQDRQRPLEAYAQYLGGMVYLKGLGTYLDKSKRLAALVEPVGAALGLDGAERRVARRAAELCKADLVTAMVGEFPKLQGEVGEIYADLDGEAPGVGRGIAEHYLPKSADGPLPRSPAGVALSLAEKFDNLAACFSMGLSPTGSADPYALRRQGQAALRIAAASGRFFSLSSLARAALERLPEDAPRGEDVEQAVLSFLRDRLTQLALDDGLPHDLVRAAMAVGFDDVTDYWLRLRALEALSGEPVWPDLVTVAERTFNISKGLDARGEPDPSLFQEDEERELHGIVQRNRDEMLALLDRREYAAAARRYAEVFAEPVHRFFDRVFVNVDDEGLKRNRLALVRSVHALFGERVANLSEITTGASRD